MRTAIAAAFVAAFLVACGGGSGDMLHVCPDENTTPVSVDPDFAPSFVGTFAGTVVAETDGGPTDYIPVQFRVTRTSANKLAIRDLLKGTVVGLPTTATTADLSCMTGSSSISCGTLTVTYFDGVATLVDEGGAIDITMDAYAEGCSGAATGTITLDHAIRISAAALPDGEAGTSEPNAALTDAVERMFAARLGR